MFKFICFYYKYVNSLQVVKNKMDFLYYRTLKASGVSLMKNNQHLQKMTILESLFFPMLESFSL